MYVRNGTYAEEVALVYRLKIMNVWVTVATNSDNVRCHGETFAGGELGRRTPNISTDGQLRCQK